MKLSDQRMVTRGFVAKHITKSHGDGHSLDGCMICVAWYWARELREIDDEAVKIAMEGLKPLIEVIDG